MKGWVRAAIIAALASTSATLGGGDESPSWPMFRGPKGDGVSSETAWSSDWPAGGPKILWKARVGNGYSSFAVVAGRLYTMGNLSKDKQDVVWCLDALTGAEIWRFSYASPPGGYPGPRVTPTVDGDRVYVASRHALMHCLDAATGKVIWTKDLAQALGARFQMHGYSSSPVVFGDLLIVEIGAKDAAVAALDKKTGELVWKSGEGEPGYSTPVLYEKDGQTRIAMFMADGLIGLDAKTGKPLYRFPFPVKYGHAIASPIVDGGRVFLSAGYGSGAVLVDVAADPPAAVWRSIEFSNHFTTSVLFKGYLYGFDGDNERAPVFKCVEFATGKCVWTKEGFGRGSLMLAGDRLIILCGAGDLAVAQASPEGCKELARSKILAGVCWTPPVLMNGLIYCRTQDGVLVCVDARAHGSSL